jgi:hypothetical protein
MSTTPHLGRGINLGGWLSQAPNDEEHRRTFITERDVQRIAGWGFGNIACPGVRPAHRVPLYCGEFGVYDRAPAEDTLAIFAESRVAWSMRSCKDMGFGLVDNAGVLRNPALLAILRGAP